jgi:hypothetical protein
MIHQVWRLSENDSEDNLGLACTAHGLVLRRTPLIERRDGRFIAAVALEERSNMTAMQQLDPKQRHKITCGRSRKVA